MKVQYSINGFSKGKLRNPQIILISTLAILLLSFFPFYYYPSLLLFVQNSSQSISFSPSPPQLLPPPPPPLPSLLPSPPPPLPSLLPSPPPQFLFPPPPPLLKAPLSSSSIPPQTTNVSSKKECDVTRGKWIRDPHAPYYTNTTCWTIQEHQNCMKYGRPNMEFLKWRWKPEGCELPLFNPDEFLRIVRGKSMAFVGDSLARNQMQSLMCLLSRVEYPKDVSETSDENFKRMYYESYDFKISIFWSPFLVRAEEPEGGEGPLALWKLHLDRVDRNWYAHIDKFDYLIISSGNWFTRPSLYYQKRKAIGCNYCQTSRTIRRMTLSDANRKAFQTAFWAINNSKKFKGVTILRTLSPAHFENGKWDEGGDCNRTRPFKKHETKLENEDLKLYKDQLEEFKEAQAVGRSKGLSFRLLDTTQAMLLRPDGHPSRYGHWPEANVVLYNDCVHWCLPGPIDMWNDLLLQITRVEEDRSDS